MRTTLVREIDPLMRGDFKLTLRGVGSFDRTDVPVVGRQFILDGERKRRFQVSAFRFLIDDVAELDAIACISG